MQNIQPRDINEARRLANSYEKAQEILKDGYQFRALPETDSVAVCKPGRTAACYWIDLFDGTCDCPDFQKRGRFCKHTLAWQILEEEKARIESLFAEMERQEADAECATGCDPYAEF